MSDVEKLNERISRLTRDVEEAKEVLAAFKDAARLPQCVTRSKRITVPATIYHQVNATLTRLSRPDIKEDASD